MEPVHQAGSHARTSWPVAVALLAAVAGLVFAAGAVTSRGSDIRPAGGDIGTLLKDRAQRVADQRKQAQELREAIAALSASAPGGDIEKLRRRVAELQDLTGLSRAVGPGLRVTLTDAPRSSDGPGIDPNILVVHQQDIQGFVNALWAGGAEAISLQGQRLVTTTGIKCVGSTVVLDGVPYAPPYVIEAVGSTRQLRAALDASPEVTIYRAYVDRYELGLDISTEGELDLDPYTGTVNIEHARLAS